jgi:hypothetical protein
METRLDDLDLLAIQIDGIHIDENMLLVAAIGVDANGDKHPLGLVEGATENATTVQALIDNLVERGLDPTVRRLFIIDGAKALSKAIRRDAAIQRCADRKHSESDEKNRLASPAVGPMPDEQRQRQHDALSRSRTEGEPAIESSGPMTVLPPFPGTDWTDRERAEIDRLEACCRDLGRSKP